MKICKKISILFFCMFVLAACGSSENDDSNSTSNSQEQSQNGFQATYDWEMPDFQFINQDNEEIGLADLKGQPFLANFIFTNCATVCPPMTFNTAKLQEAMKEAGVNHPIISFTVDPTRDTPEALKEYAKNFNADHSNWHFLTGYSEDEIKLMAKAFKTLAEAEEGTDQFIHSTRLYLINKDGVIVKGYDSLKIPHDEVINDLKLLSK